MDVQKLAKLAGRTETHSHPPTSGQSRPNMTVFWNLHIFILDMELSSHNGRMTENSWLYFLLLYKTNVSPAPSNPVSMRVLFCFWHWLKTRESVSPADVTVCLPALTCAQFAAADAALEKRMPESRSKSQTLRRLVLQHGLDQVEQLVMLLGFRQKISP